MRRVCGIDIKITKTTSRINCHGMDRVVTYMNWGAAQLLQLQLAKKIRA
jgi:hypothetical protein